MTASKKSAPLIRPATAADAAAIADIYNYYILNSTITFEEECLSTARMLERLAAVQRRHPWLVCEDHGSIAGYAYADSWKLRHSYRHSVESTIYLHEGATGRRLGAQLYGKLIELLKPAGFHTVIGAIALPNEGSVALHARLGFAKVAHLKEVGWKFQRWIDVGYWQLLL